VAYYQIDSSSIIKRYVHEPGSEWIRALCHPNSGNQIGLVTVAKVEVASAFCRRHREGTVTRQERGRLLKIFLFDCV